MARKSSQPRAIRAFVSHRYGSPTVNLRFFEIFSRVAQVQFSVDFGELATNVTRLERLVRDADAFIGIYPLSVEPQESPSIEELRKQARYFRLELDLAMRARLPSIVFADERYGRVLECPDWIRRYSFSAQEVEAAASPRMEVLAKAFKEFGHAAFDYQSFRMRQALSQRERSKVALLLPSIKYPQELRRRIGKVVEDAANREVIDFDWPPRLGGAFHSSVGDIDWAIVDIGDEPETAAVAGFLQGSFVPTIRLAAKAEGAARRALVGDFEAGYPKDVLQWSDEEALQVGLAARMRTVLMQHRLIADVAGARAYFESAALRKEIVFVSYAGADDALAKPVIDALRKSFKTVFDYKDGASIKPGRPWLEEIFSTIGRAAAAVTLLSARYLASGNCLHEAREIVARRDEGRLTLLPLRLTDEKIETPDWLRDLQHARLSQLAGPQDVPRLVAQALTPPGA